MVVVGSLSFWTFNFFVKITSAVNQQLSTQEVRSIWPRFQRPWISLRLSQKIRAAGSLLAQSGGVRHVLEAMLGAFFPRLASPPKIPWMDHDGPHPLRSYG